MACTLPPLVSLLPPHQQRVIAEKADLFERAQKLEAFIGKSEIYLALPPEDRMLLEQQLVHMKAYADILAQRIARFA